MAQPFSFGFSGDDIEEDPNDALPDGENSAVAANASSTDPSQPPAVEARTHNIDELLSTLPSKISYNTIEIESPKGHKIRLPRRELFDIRMQLMAEDSGTDSAPLSGLDESDIKTNVYEGGFKSWECSIDLVKFLLDRGPRKDLDDLCRVDHVIELGCGTALPTLLLFHYALTASIPLYLTLADYNASVLRLVTLPNLLLTYTSTFSATASPFSNESPNPLADPSTDHGDLDVTPEILSSFKSALTALPLSLTLISGSWTPTPKFLELVPSAPEMNTFLLASETIYSPTALNAFTEVMAGILARVRAGKAVVAAKRVYFGVGGGVDEFRVECSRLGAVAGEVEFEGLGEGDGVRRSLVEVQML
ncbi:uncharacterized protein BDZ99DRAFT_445556 [Mytilinidion resinicola]|uniref:protein-histidine N-methyltransferase n=1 Tax=Mytilinidion resinicola TaxID=574789 RepID=A0A6A6YI74_9PEZI|nr:uncharacterized protein BDZ99DRAFT_445556 [Mytilinidion resinicola]KAF2808258.1 hypothetical protein BDZ99DRAFT_445556 [Mytilinidion resinicola]